MAHDLAFADSDLLGAAASAAKDGRADEALRLLGEARLNSPSAPGGYLEAGKLLRAANRPHEAEAMFLDGLRRCPKRLELLIEYAWVPHYASAWPEALERWRAVADEFPRHPAGSVGIGRVLFALKRFDEAEDHLARALERFPSDPHMSLTFAHVAAARHEWRVALERWDAALDLRPGDPSAVAGRGVALWQVQLEAENAAGAEAGDGPAQRVPHGPVRIERAADPQAAALVKGFESLGENCEFGLVQRRFGAEPLGLLRWTYTSPDSLARLLEARFAGLGEPDAVSLHRTHWKEYFLKDSRFGVTFHTWLTQDVADEEAFRVKQAARLRWLRDKLLADLGEGGKVFVYKAHHGATGAEIGRVAEALRAYGPNTLFCVSLAGASDAVGKVEKRGEGLLRGYLSRLNPTQGGQWDIPFDEWLALCRQASDMAATAVPAP